MSKRIHRPCPYRTRRKVGRGGVMVDWCTVNGDKPPEAPRCSYCADRRNPVRGMHASKSKRIRQEDMR